MRPGRPAALLLEVVVALAVLVAAMGLLGAQLAGALNMTSYSEEQLRAALLADRILALVQLDPELQRLVAEDDLIEDLFGEEYPGYFWRVTTEPLERDRPDELKLVTIQVLYQPVRELQESRSGISTATVLRQLAFFKGKPGTINLVEQAGLTEEQAEELRQAIPIPGFDPTAIDLQQLMAMLTSDQIMQLLPMLMPLLQQIAGGSLPAELAGLAEQFGSTLGPEGTGGTSPGDLAGAIGEAVRGAQGPRGAGTQPPPTPGRMPAAGGQTPGRAPAQAPVAGGPGRTPAPSPPPAGGGVNIGRGSGPNGEYTIEDLMRMRDEYERLQGGGR